MKPRFSILTVLGLTAFAAVDLSGLIDPMGVFSTTSIFLWLIAMLWLGVEAVQVRSNRSVVAGAMLLGCLAYVALSAIDDDSFSSPLPHWKMLELMAKPNRPAWEEYEIQSYQKKKVLAIVNCSLAIGGLSGGLALWRYRVAERRAKEPPK